MLRYWVEMRPSGDTRRVENAGRLFDADKLDVGRLKRDDVLLEVRDAEPFAR